MKRASFSTAICLLLLTAMISCTSKPSSFTLTATINGLPEGTVVELMPGATHQSERPIAESIVKDGSFTFKGTLKEPRLFEIVAINTEGSIKVLIEKGDVTVSGKATSTESEGKLSYQYDSIIVTGSDVHTLYKEKLAFLDSLNTLYDTFHASNKEIMEALKIAQEAHDDSLIRSLLQTEAFEKMQNDNKAIYDSVEVRINKLITDNKKTWWAPFLMMDQMYMFDAQDKLLFVEFSGKAQNSYYGKLLKIQLDAITEK
ncbi:MAG: DUF4369 domain-containing protein [Bacteroidales bacterium]|jgi:hypothetical protein|nr:DUF4369 domain-containing protein [Bacteroidales bacterium]MDD3160817.1 DUF4369 domain-containing protein [Bacteroidales bacterium]